MTTKVQARDRITFMLESEVKPALGLTELFYEKTKVIDLDTVASPFARSSITIENSKQASVELKPLRRVYGALTMTIFFKEGDGHRATLGLIDQLDQILGPRNLDGVQMMVPVTTEARAAAGWEGYEVRVNFYFDTRTT